MLNELGFGRTLRRPAIEATATPQERRIIDYHRNSLRSGNVGKDAEGRPVTVYSTGILVREGPLKGKYVSVPGFVDGRIVENDDELYRRWKKEIDAGKWPAYDDPETLNFRSRTIHEIMDMESPW